MLDYGDEAPREDYDAEEDVFESFDVPDEEDSSRESPKKMSVMWNKPGRAITFAGMKVKEQDIGQLEKEL